MSSTFQHVPVLHAQTIEHLQVKEGEKYIDATIGGGGHTELILKRGGVVLGIDQDPDAVAHLQEKFGNEIILVQDNFENIKKIAREKAFAQAAGILFDLGVSSHQLDTPERGFSYRFESPLDMRMDQAVQKNAHQIVNKYTRGELERVFATYAEHDKAKDIAREVVKKRKKKEINTTLDLISCLEGIGLSAPSDKSRIFQAIRIEANDEIGKLKKALPDAFDILKPKGRLVVISFHSLEDRVVKEFGKKVQSSKKGNLVTKKPVVATDDEIRKNKRAKSAKLRVIEKI